MVIETDWTFKGIPSAVSLKTGSVDGISNKIKVEVWFQA